MKNIFSLFIACVYSSILLAQNKIEVTGQIKDAQTKDALEFCTITALNTKDSLIAGTVTNNKGFFTLPIEPGIYLFVFSFTGYKKDTTQAMMVSSNKFIGVFKIEPVTEFLNEVNVKSNSSENQLDRDVQIVTDKMKTGSTNTKEVLEKINGVTYDRYSNSIKVDNDEKVIILVDGLEKDQEYIKNLSPDRLKKVEIIRDPGGRYALEGYSAVINIVLKKEYQGTEMFLSDRAMLDLDASKKEYIPVQNNISGTVNYVYNKVNIYAKYSNNYNNFNLTSNARKDYNNGLTIESTPLYGDKEINTKVKQMYNNYTLGADYYINPKNTLSFESNLGTQPLRNNTSKELYQVIIKNNDAIIEDYQTETENASKNMSSYNSLFYESRINENNVINANFTYFNYSDSYTNTYAENLMTLRNENGTNQKNNTKFYLEYTRTFKNKTSLQIGYGNTWQKTNNNYTADSIKSNFDYSDFRHKFYAYYSFILGKNFSVKFGAASETSKPKANGQTNSYFIVQPYADIKYKLNEKLDFKVKYRAKTNYPNISETNPFTYVIDQQSVKTGNPFLKPELTHRISLQTNILGGLVTIEPYYCFSNNYITETGSLRQDSIFEYKYNNSGYFKYYGVEARFTIPFGKSIFLQSDFDIFNSSIRFSGKTNNVNDWSMTNKLIYQNQKNELVAGLQYQNNLRKYITAQGYNMWDNDFWVLFVQKPFLKKKLSVMLLYFLPINWGVDFNQGSYIKTNTYSESKLNNISLLKNMIMVEISYRFNKGKTVNKKEKNIEQNNEKSSKGFL